MSQGAEFSRFPDVSQIPYTYKDLSVGKGVAEKEIAKARKEEPRIVMFSDETMKEVFSRRWYHQIRFGKYVTPGIVDMSKVFDRYGFPKDMTGLRVIDLGASDGYFTIELSRRGAKVTACELFDFNIRRLRFAKSFTELDFDIVKLDVADAQSTILESLGTFDYVLSSNVMCHIGGGGGPNSDVSKDEHLRVIERLAGKSGKIVLASDAADIKIAEKFWKKLGTSKQSLRVRVGSSDNAMTIAHFGAS